MDINEARSAYNDAVERMNAAGDAAEEALGALAADASDEEISAAEEPWRSAKAEVERRKANLDRLEAIAEARENTKPVIVPEKAEERHAVARGELRHELTYRPDATHSFFRDLISQNKDYGAADRLRRNGAEMKDELEKRNTTNTTDGQFIPPIYLADAWADVPRPARPFADALPKFPMPSTGLTVTVPKVSTGAAEAAQSSQASSVQSTDPTFTTVTAPLVTIAGQVDVARQFLERSEPGIDMVIFRDLQNAYDQELDAELLGGSGSSGKHTGLRSVSSVISVTASTTTPISVVQQIYNASQQIASNRYRPANVVVMHPRRAAWLASPSTNTNVPLFQQGALFQAFGTQDNGFAGTIAGLPVILDANVITTANPGTNQDEIYVLHMDDLLFGESAVRQATYEDVGSGSLLVRVQLYGYSFFVGARQPKSIAVISGAGLTTPSF